MPIQDPKRVPPRAFQPGDFVYGISKAKTYSKSGFKFKDRQWYIDGYLSEQGHVPGKFGRQSSADKAPRTIDELKVMPSEGSAESTEHPAEVARFKKYLEEHPKYKSVLTGGSGENEDFRRKCKAGIYWAVFVEKKHVHFTLDGINLKGVVGKDNQLGDSPDSDADGDEPKNRSVTGAELRWIYRNKHLPVIQENVQFWLNGKPCAAPWLALCRLDEQGRPDLDQNGEIDWGDSAQAEKAADGLWKPYADKLKLKQVDHAAAQEAQQIQSSDSEDGGDACCGCTIM